MRLCEHWHSEGLACAAVMVLGSLSLWFRGSKMMSKENLGSWEEVVNNTEKPLWSTSSNKYI